MNRIKPVFLLLFAFILLVLIFPFIITKKSESEHIKPQETVEAVVPSAELWMETDTDYEEDRQTEEYDTAIYIKLILRDGSVTALSLRDYLTGVVAAEMPALFELEALKAQAVAARTYSMYRLKVDQVHEGGALCTDPGCCNAYLTNDELKDKWGTAYEANLGLIKRAVEETDGICLSYDDEPIFAAFHSSSVGETENSESVWRSELPYLRSVTSPEDEATVPNYISRVTISFNEIKNLVKEAYPQAKLVSNPAKWLSGAEYSEGGRLLKINLGGIELKGTELRYLFKLRSTVVTWKVENDGILFETKGYGHGVGMSQYGANVMAKNGSDYLDILKHYYTAVEVTVISKFIDEKDPV